MSSIAASSGTEAPAEEFRWGWPVVLACFFTATFSMGLRLLRQLRVCRGLTRHTRLVTVADNRSNNPVLSGRRGTAHVRAPRH
jgi:hypothetical protein